MAFQMGALIVSVLILPLTLLLIVNYSWLRAQIMVRRTFPHPPCPPTFLGFASGHLSYFTAQRFHRNFAEWAETYGGVFWTRIFTQMVRRYCLQTRTPAKSGI